MKFREIDNVKRKTMSCLPKGCLSLPKVKRRRPKTRQGKDETDVNEDFINAYEINSVGNTPRLEVNGISKENETKTFQPSYHVYRFVLSCLYFILFYFVWAIPSEILRQGCPRLILPKH